MDKVLKFSDGSEINVTRNNIMYVSGIGPDNKADIMLLIGKLFMENDDQFTILCKVYDEFGEDATKFAWCVLAGINLRNSIDMAWISLDGNEDDDDDIEELSEKSHRNKDDSDSMYR